MDFALPSVVAAELVAHWASRCVELQYLLRSTGSVKVFLTCEQSQSAYIVKRMRNTNDSRIDGQLDPPALPGAPPKTPRIAHARFAIGAVVRHRLFGFRGVVFDVDPVFANSDEWYEAIPEAMRPARDQPFYHLFAENDETSYVAYVSQQNLVGDQTGAPIDHPEIATVFSGLADGKYQLNAHNWH